jgi:hypothetical protein
MLGSSWMAAQLAAVQEGLSCMSEWGCLIFIMTPFTSEVVYWCEDTLHASWSNVAMAGLQQQTRVECTNATLQWVVIAQWCFLLIVSVVPIYKLLKEYLRFRKQCNLFFLWAGCDNMLSFKCVQTYWLLWGAVNVTYFEYCPLSCVLYWRSTDGDWLFLIGQLNTKVSSLTPDDRSIPCPKHRVRKDSRWWTVSQIAVMFTSACCWQKCFDLAFYSVLGEKGLIACGIWITEFEIWHTYQSLIFLKIVE